MASQEELDRFRTAGLVSSDSEEQVPVVHDAEIAQEGSALVDWPRGAAHLLWLDWPRRLVPVRL